VGPPTGLLPHAGHHNLWTQYLDGESETSDNDTSIYGLLGGNQRKEKLRRCRALLGLDAALPTVKPESCEVMLKRLTGIDVQVCPVCGVGHMLHKRDLKPSVGGRQWHPRLHTAEGLRRAAWGGRAR
jgi:hypothetical protein